MCAGFRSRCRSPRQPIANSRLTCQARLCLLVLCAAFALCGASPPASATRDVEQAARTAEWGRLVNLWHALTDHSADLVYSRPLFDDLVKHMDKADSDLTGLAERGIIPGAAAEGLRRLFHSRYQYIAEHHYTEEATVSVTESEGARGAASWIVELQLSVLRRAQSRSEENREFIEGAESSAAYELTFIHHLDKFEAKAERRRADLKAREDAGEEVDLEAFDNDCNRRRRLLLEAYRARRLPRVRAVDDLLPYLFALTRARPTCSAAALASLNPEP